MGKTQNIFKKISKLLKKYRYNQATQKVERDEFRDEFLETNHVNHKINMNSKKKKTFRMRGSAVVASVFLMLAGAGVVDAQTRAYEILYNGNSIGYVDSPAVLETALNSIGEANSGNSDVNLGDYEIRVARFVDCMTTEEIAQAIAGTKTNKTVQVAQSVNYNQTPVNQAAETPVAETPVVENPTVEAPTVETPAVATPTVVVAPTAETATVAVAAAETPAVVAPATETPTVERKSAEISVAEVTPAEETPVAETPAVQTPAVESPVVETPAIQTPAVETPAVESPVVETPAVETPTVETPAVETPAVETPAVVTPQAQFVLPASGRVGEIFRDYDSGYYSNHSNGAAVDILNSEGTSVHAAASGTVTFAGWYGGYGNCVMIDHDNGYSTLYGHFSALNVAAGQTVAQGQIIGSMGSTGSSTANHVHFEILLNNVAQPINNFFNISTGDNV
ncbi:peptidoglycan DD-metalloendopeptidase family protein [Acetobacterium paludosum]|uniref:Peptidoglycan DD-metalloendopeptidase family protein n=1 Tax=Acetobacterium paludosum TaxID=52693 RepID=A0A923KQH4_9FIRM|nr:M23 family metallopeptidase [Acetobacterium paludosum]MBC3889144.1 peptidoglycan DD-metalloendopeptidase family protein [Acetobacterium paludosum]